jgi:site-specific recombinase XerD
MAPTTPAVAAGTSTPAPGISRGSAADGTLPPKERPDIIDWRAQLARLEGAYSQATLKGYAADFSSFTTYCSRLGESALPAAPETVAEYVTDAGTRLAASTLRRHIAAIAKLHRLARLASPCQDEEVRIALRRVVRTKGRRQSQALGLTETLLEQLLGVCDSATLSGLRDRALLLVACDTLCRRSELCALRFEDLTPTPDGGRLALVRRSKNDPLGDGRTAYLTPRAVTAVEAWRATAGIDDGEILRGLRNARVRPAGLSPGSIPEILKDIARRAGLAPDVVARLSGHSPRVGRAQEMSLGGADALAIMRAGGWKTINTVARYIENAEMQRLGARTWDAPAGS